MLSTMFVRFEATTANLRGIRPGVFALANGLAHAGKVSADDYAWWRSSNDWMNAAYNDPTEIGGTLFDRSTHPCPECWFRTPLAPDWVVPAVVRALEWLGFEVKSIE